MYQGIPAELVRQIQADRRLAAARRRYRRAVRDARG
jgi:hypothetical protein